MDYRLKKRLVLTTRPVNNTPVFLPIRERPLYRKVGASMEQTVQVLIVDDNEDAAMSLTMLLELEDIASAAAPDATAALALLDRISAPLMLIDIGLPGMNGFELARRLRARPDTCKATLIALTGREASQQDPDAAVFDQFWTKPFDPRKLLAEVKSVIGRDREAACSANV